MDLWQKQMSAVISDKQFIQAMLELFQNMQMPDYARKSSPAAASHPAHAPDAGHELLAELAFRLAMCEKRLAALEQQGEKSGKKPKTAPKNTTRRAGAGGRRGSKKPR